MGLCKECMNRTDECDRCGEDMNLTRNKIKKVIMKWSCDTCGKGYKFNHDKCNNISNQISEVVQLLKDIKDMMYQSKCLK